MRPPTLPKRREEPPDHRFELARYSHPFAHRTANRPDLRHFLCNRKLAGFVALCIVIAGAGVTLLQGDESNRFAVIRETESQHKTKLSAFLESKMELSSIAPANTVQDGAAHMQGKSLGQILPPASIKEIFVPYYSINQSQRFDLSNESIRSLFSRCVFISEEQFQHNHLIAWKTLVATTDAHERVGIELMLGGNLGRIRFNDARPAPFQCVDASS